ncbi:hypothetical protein YTPLAS72_02220 [Nitrospira sp.]|nr:hypothetical protein YTPLAS72_02220 [Nitrospira sp.]
MSKPDKLRVSAFLMVLSGFITGCIAPHAGDHPHQKLEEVEKRATELSGNHENTMADLHGQPVKPTNVVPHGEEDRHSIQRGNTLFNGKASCFGCHGHNGDIRTASPAKVTSLDPLPTDLRKPTSKSVRQLFLVVKYGIPGTGMVPLKGTAKLRDEDIFDLLAYVLNLQGSPHSLAVISTQSLRPHTETDVAIAVMCQHEAMAHYDTEEHCDDRYAKRYRELIIGRPPDISPDRYAEIERECKQNAAGDLDTLMLCYRAEYTASRSVPRPHR